MIGQEIVLNKLKSFSLKTLPQSIMLIGEAGSGRHTLAAEISKYYNLSLIDITDETLDQIIDYQHSATCNMYLINLDTLTEKQQNQFLKLVEEPSKSMYLVLLAESTIGVLQTLLDRCQVYQLEEYTNEQLKLVNKNADDLVCEICPTPGQIINFDISSIQPMLALCNTIVTNLTTLSVGDFLSFTYKINFKDNFKLFDFNAFFRLLIKVAREDYYKNNNKLSYKLYLFTTTYLQKLLYKTINKENFTINYFTTLRERILYGD